MSYLARVGRGPGLKQYGWEGRSTGTSRLPFVSDTPLLLVAGLAVAVIVCLFAEANPAWPESRQIIRFSGELASQESFALSFGPGLRFHLNPLPHGWEIVVRRADDEENLARLTPPLHGINPRYLEGWHFRNADNTGPNQPGLKNVNAPGLVREFIFSPEVGRTIDGPDAGRKPIWPEIEAVRAFGQGRLTILGYTLANLKTHEKAAFSWLKFEVELSWPALAGAGSPYPSEPR